MMTQVLALPASILLDLAKLIFLQQDHLDNCAKFLVRMSPVDEFGEEAENQGQRVLAALGMALSLAKNQNVAMQALVQAIAQEFPTAHHGPH